MRVTGLVATVGLLLLISACAADSIGERAETPDEAREEPTPTPGSLRGDAGQVPLLGPEDACVPADEIHFNTFVSGIVAFSDASPSLIERLRDAIPPLDHPRYEPAADAYWLGSSDIVLGYADGDEAYAYPILIMNFHEIVNEEVNGRPILISYCPLCASGIAYDRRLGDETLTFGNTSALYESDLVMYDHQTGSYWQQVLGEGIVGPMCGERLDLLPLLTTSWQIWRELHPHTLVLSRETGHQRPYHRDPFVGYDDMLNRDLFPFPVGESARDDRLSAGDLVLTIEHGGAAYAYSLSRLGDAAVNDVLDDLPVVVFSQVEGTTGAAFEPIIDGQPLRFEADGRAFTDVETGSTWTVQGEATEGPLAGRQLEPVPARVTFWFAIVATTPEVEVRAP
jgi:hypothetical protein